LSELPRCRNVSQRDRDWLSLSGIPGLGIRFRPGLYWAHESEFLAEFFVSRVRRLSSRTPRCMAVLASRFSGCLAYIRAEPSRFSDIPHVLTTGNVGRRSSLRRYDERGIFGIRIHRSSNPKNTKQRPVILYATSCTLCSALSSHEFTSPVYRLTNN
jgi:hypothetical protein